MTGQPLTKERMLLELRTAHFASDLPVSLASAKFQAMLADQCFAKDARDIVSYKIEQIRDNRITFHDSASRLRTMRAWERALAIIDESLYPNAQSRG